MADWGRNWANRTLFDPSALSMDHQDALASSAAPWTSTREISEYLVHDKLHSAAAPSPQSPSLCVDKAVGEGKGHTNCTKLICVCTHLEGIHYCSILI